MSIARIQIGTRPTFTGLSADTKPVQNTLCGSLFFEADTGHWFVLETDQVWHPYSEAVSLSDASGNPISSSGGNLNANAWLWQPTSLSWVHALADVSGNLLTSGAGGGGGTVNQGTAAALAGAWPIKITDGSNGPAAVTAANALKVDGSAVTQPVSGTVTTTPPANASTNLAQVGGTNVSTGTGTGGAGIPRVTVSSDSFPATQAVSGTVTANQGAPPWSFNLTQVSGGTIALGQAAMAASLPVAIASNQSAIPVSQSGTWSITVNGQPISVAQSGAWAVSVSNFPATQAVTQSGVWSVSLNGQPLSVNATLMGPLTSTGGLNVDATLQGIDLGPNEMAQSLPVVLALDQPPVLVDGSQVTQPVSGTVAISNFPATQPIAVTALPLPPNAAQESGGNLALLTQLVQINVLVLAELRALRMQFANQTSERDYPDASDVLDATTQLN